MAKAKTAAKKPSALLGKPKKDGKGYSRTQLVAHLAEAVSAKGLGDVTKKQSAAFIEELVGTMMTWADAKSGAALPGLGKLIIRKTPKRPARKGRNPATGEEVTIPAKPAGKKLVFRVAKAAKESIQ